MYAFMVECWHEIPQRRPPFAEIHARLLQWEGGPGAGAGYQPSVTSASGMSGTSPSVHSSTGPSNNTGSTNISQQGHIMIMGGQMQQR